MSPETLAWIEKQKPDLVRSAEDYVKQTKLFKRKGRGDHPRVSGSQLRNLLSAAQSGSPLAVLINFLHYQIGRKNQGWADQRSGEELGKLLDKDIRRLSREGAKQKGAEDVYELESHLAAQLLGFVIREYTYRCSVEGTRP
jgi:hypothetical protein